MVGTWRTIYYLIGWSYPNDPSNRTLQARSEMLIQIRKSKLKLKSSKKKRSHSQHKPKKFKMKKNKIKNRYKCVLKPLHLNTEN